MGGAVVFAAFRRLPRAARSGVIAAPGRWQLIARISPFPQCRCPFASLCAFYPGWINHRGYQAYRSCCPDVCTLHPTTSHSTSYDDHVLPLADVDEIVPSGATTPLEIAPGDPLLRPRALHSPTLARHFPAQISSFKSPASSLSPSSHPPCPPSRAASPDANGAFVDDQQQPQSHRWVLHPRRGHAALNSGLKSLSGRALTVVGRPDDLMRATGGSIGQGELGEDVRLWSRSCAGGGADSVGRAGQEGSRARIEEHGRREGRGHRLRARLARRQGPLECV